AHSSGASRLTLAHRAVQPGGGGGVFCAAPFAVSAGAAAGAGAAGAVCADFGAALDFCGCCALLAVSAPDASMARTRPASLMVFFMNPVPARSTGRSANFSDCSTNQLKHQYLESRHQRPNRYCLPGFPVAPT